jgi:hypothetical protein
MDPISLHPTLKTNTTAFKCTDRLQYPPLINVFRQKNNKETSELNDTIDKIYLIDIYRVFHLAAVYYTFFSTADETFSKIYDILGHKASLSKFQKVEITPCILSDHNRIKLELYLKRN